MYNEIISIHIHVFIKSLTLGEYKLFTIRYELLIRFKMQGSSSNFLVNFHVTNKSKMRSDSFIYHYDIF